MEMVAGPAGFALSHVRHQNSPAERGHGNVAASAAAEALAKPTTSHDVALGPLQFGDLIHGRTDSLGSARQDKHHCTSSQSHRPVARSVGQSLPGRDNLTIRVAGALREGYYTRGPLSSLGLPPTLTALRNQADGDTCSSAYAR